MTIPATHTGMTWTAWGMWSECRKEGVHVVKTRDSRLCDVDGSDCIDERTENKTCIGKETLLYISIFLTDIFTIIRNSNLTEQEHVPS